MVASVTGSARIAVVSGGLLSVAGALVVTFVLPRLWHYDSRRPAPGHLAWRRA